MDLLQVGVQIEHTTHTAHDVGDQARVDRTQLQTQFRALRVGGDAQQGGALGCAEHALVAVFADQFDARQAALAQEGQHAREVQRWAVHEPQYQAAVIGGQRLVLATQRRRCHAAALQEGGIEAAQTVVAGGQRNIGHRQRGSVSSCLASSRRWVAWICPGVAPRCSTNRRCSWRALRPIFCARSATGCSCRKPPWMMARARCTVARPVPAGPAVPVRGGSAGTACSRQQRPRQRSDSR